MSVGQLFICCMSVGLCQSAAKGKGKGEKKQTHESNKDWGPWGSEFVFFCFLVSCLFVFIGFLVSWFSGSLLVFLKGWQNKTKVKDLDLTLCQFSHFRGCKLTFGWFYWLLWACSSIRKPCKKRKKTSQNAGITGGSLGGLRHRLGNFVCLYNCSKTVLNKCKNIGSQWMCRIDSDIDIVVSNPWVDTYSNILKDSLEKEWCISLKWVLPSTSPFLLKW